MKKFFTAFLILLMSGLFIAINANAQETQGSRFEVITPTDGQTLYGNKVPILFSAENFTLTDATTKKVQPGEGHILAWLDQANPNLENATKITSDAFTFADVAYGNHTLKVELVTPTNASLTPAKVVTVNFKTAELPSSVAAENSSFDKKTTAVILVIVALVIVAAWWYTKDEDLEEEVKKETQKPAKKTKRITRKKTRRKK